MDILLIRRETWNKLPVETKLVYSICYEVKKVKTVELDKIFVIPKEQFAPK